MGHTIATVTLNPAVDKTMVIPRFAVGKTNRGSIEQIDPAGKGINVAQAVKQLGCSVIASGFLAGNNGRYISESLIARGILTDFVYLPGETRVNLKIIDPVAGTETEINDSGFQVEAEHLKQLEQKIEELASKCVVMVFSGSLPPGVPVDTYAAFIRIAKGCGAKTILDSCGAALKSGVTARPDLIKPNRIEVEELLQTSFDGEEELIDAARQLLALGPGAVVISLGAHGALMASADELVRARPPAIKTGSTIGAGDAMVAAFAYALTKNLPLNEAIRLATAASSATAAVNGTRMADSKLIQEFLPRVMLEEVRDGYRPKEEVM